MFLLYPLVSSLSPPPQWSEASRPLSSLVLTLWLVWSAKQSGGVGLGGVVAEGEERRGRGGEGGGRTMVLLWQQLPPVFIWKPCRGTKIVPARALTCTATWVCVCAASGFLAHFWIVIPIITTTETQSSKHWSEYVQNNRSQWNQEKKMKIRMKVQLCVDVCVCGNSKKKSGLHTIMLRIELS